MKNLLIILMLLVGSVCYGDSVTFQEGVDSYTGTKDIYIYEDSANTNYGTSGVINVKSVTGTYERKGFVKFDVSSISSSATVSSATLYLYIENNHDCNETFSVFRAFKTWTETGATFNDWVSPDSEWGTAGAKNASDSGSDNSGDGADYDRKSTAEDTFVYGSYDGPEWTDYDVTTAVQNWVDGGWTNNGLVVNCTDSSGCDTPTFTSSEDTGDTTKRPKLEVVYTVSSGGTTHVFNDTFVGGGLYVE